jgi:hypothetical protein
MKAMNEKQIDAIEMLISATICGNSQLGCENCRLYNDDNCNSKLTKENLMNAITLLRSDIDIYKKNAALAPE